MLKKNDTVMLSLVNPNLSVEDKKGKVVRESKRYWWVDFGRHHVVKIKRSIATALSAVK